MRRILRIAPLYFVVLAFCFFILPWVVQQFGSSVNLPERPWMYWTFLSNYEGSDCMYALKFLWSISVQEQFYLLFLLITLVFVRRFWIVVTAMTIVFLGFQIPALQSGASTYCHVPTYLPFFAMGMIGGRFLEQLLSFKWSVLIGLALLPFLWFASDVALLFNPALAIVYLSILILFVQLFARFGMHTLLPWRLLESMGRYTYGMYVFSGFALTFLPFLIEISSPTIEPIVIFGCVLIAGICSYHLFERRFLDMKKYFPMSRSAKKGKRMD